MKVTNEIEKQMDNMELDKYDQEENMLQFTSELAEKMKENKEK